MIKTNRYLLDVAMATLFAFPIAALAELKAQDVVGVRLGMKVKQAEAALRAHEPNFRFLKAYYRGIDGKPTGFVMGCAQSIKVLLAEPIAAGVYHMYRVWLFDHRLLETDARAIQARRQTQQEQLNRKAQDSAASNKQRL